MLRSSEFEKGQSPFFQDSKNGDIFLCRNKVEGLERVWNASKGGIKCNGTLQVSFDDPLLERKDN